MKAYVSVFSARFRMLLQYRAAALAGFATQLFWGLIRVMIFQAFFLSSRIQQPMNVEEVTTYIWLGQAIFAILPFRPAAEIISQVREGSIAFEMLRPVNIYFFWYCRSLAEKLAPTILRASPLIPIAGLFFGMQSPANQSALLFFVVSLSLAFLLSAAFAMLLNILLLWTLSPEGINSITGALLLIFSGMIVPIPFFPDSLQFVVKSLPFRGIIDTPLRIYTGDCAGLELIYAILHQTAWIAVLFVLGYWMMSKAWSRLVIQGG